MVGKMASEALNKDRGKNYETTACIRILDGLHNLNNRSYEYAVLKLIEVEIPEIPEEAGKGSPILEIVTPNDLAYYIALATLMSCDRLTIKNTVLKSNFLNLASGPAVDAVNILEHYLNGNY